MPVLMPLQMNSERGTAVRVAAPARLHLGFLDPSGTLGRRFGSLGLVIDGLDTVVEIVGSASDAVVAVAPSAQAEVERVRACLQRLRAHSGRVQPLTLRLLQAAPAHAGFGSGTQLALAVGKAFACWHGLEVDTATLADWLGRGARSGIGIAGFDHGGLLVDGGPDAHGHVAPLLARADLPASWRVVLVQDSRRRGLSGGEEVQAIGALAALPQAQAADICHQVLMRVLPGAASTDFASFAAGINQVQRILGEHFAPAQGGSAFTSEAVGRALRWMGAARLHDPLGDDLALSQAAIGQSSWGPTGFAVLPSLASAQAVVEAAHAAGAVDPALSLCIVTARRHGAVVQDSRDQRRHP
jgi:beta-ribofuranosylaminobenzene 5'-phosphate synthase